MVAHRKNVPPRQGYVPSSWFIVLTVMVVIGAGGWLGWLVLDDGSPSADAAAPSASPSASEPAAPAASSAEPTEAAPTPEPTQTSEPAPEADREATVSVLNNSGVVGAARAFSVKVTGAGWTLGGIGNWTGSIGANTIYYPAGLQDQAELLSDDVDIERVLPSVAPMRMDRLTIILSGPQ
ncbi:MAG: LytR C-terminal domain-containing protein [Aeromicrobium sp.]